MRAFQFTLNYKEYVLNFTPCVNCANNIAFLQIRCCFTLHCFWSKPILTTKLPRSMAAKELRWFWFELPPVYLIKCELRHSIYAECYPLVKFWMSVLKCPMDSNLSIAKFIFTHLDCWKSQHWVNILVFTIRHCWCGVVLCHFTPILAFYYLWHLSAKQL